MLSEVTSSNCPFSSKTFEFLELLDKEPTHDSYIAHKEEYKKYVENQLRKFVEHLVNKLPDEMTKWLDIENRKFADPSWNSFYKCSFYAKGSNSLSDAHLHIYIDSERLMFGFQIFNGSPNKDLFFQNIRLFSEIKDLIINKNLDKQCRVINLKKRTNNSESLASWMENPTLKNSLSRKIYSNLSLSTNEVLRLSTEEISTKITDKFKHVFPLFLLATCDDPIRAIREYLNPHSPISLPSSTVLDDKLRQKHEYHLKQFAEETGFKEETLVRWKRIIERKRQAILYGAPGTGKTYVAKKLAEHLSSNDGFWELVQFHSAYTYEDFIQGIRPKVGTNGQLEYPTVPGRFLEFCKKAILYQGLCTLIIDEINRANLAQVFGELMYLLEYRNEKIYLASSNKAFEIPKNVRIIGTMNTADRSIALIDHALRRRFAFIELRPNYDVLRGYHQKTGLAVEGLINILQQLNQVIADKNYEIGISFFLTDNLQENIEDIWRMEIEPYLEEYFFNQIEKVENFRWDTIKQNLWTETQ